MCKPKKQSGGYPVRWNLLVIVGAITVLAFMILVVLALAINGNLKGVNDFVVGWVDRPFGSGAVQLSIVGK